MIQYRHALYTKTSQSIGWRNRVFSLGVRKILASLSYGYTEIYIWMKTSCPTCSVYCLYIYIIVYYFFYALLCWIWVLQHKKIPYNLSGSNWLKTIFIFYIALGIRKTKMFEFSVWSFVHGTIMGINICSRLSVYPCAQR